MEISGVEVWGDVANGWLTFFVTIGVTLGMLRLVLWFLMGGMLRRG